MFEEVRIKHGRDREGWVRVSISRTVISNGCVDQSCFLVLEMIRARWRCRGKYRCAAACENNNMGGWHVEHMSSGALAFFHRTHGRCVALRVVEGQEFVEWIRFG